MSSTPPCRSSPCLVGFVAMTTADPIRRPRTRRRTKRLRRRSVTAMPAVSLLGRGQHEQQSAVVVVRGEQVGGRLGRQVALGVDLHGLAERAHAPLQDGADVVGAVLEHEAQHLADVAADDALVVEARQLERAAATADHAALLVTDEEGGVRGGVVVVEQLEEEAEAALRAALRLAGEAGGAIALGTAIAAAGTDEEMSHGFSLSLEKL